MLVEVKEVYLLSAMSRTALRPTHPPIQCVPGAVFPEMKQEDVKLITHLH
jgi:hypothetical protein